MNSSLAHQDSSGVQSSGTQSRCVEFEFEASVSVQSGASSNSEEEGQVGRGAGGGEGWAGVPSLNTVTADDHICGCDSRIYFCRKEMSSEGATSRERLGERYRNKCNKRGI